MNNMDTTNKKEINRFNSHVKIVNECHIWQNALDKDGYGRIYIFKKLRKAHRVGYFISKGDIHEGMVIDHICKNRACVNPEHLRQVTKRENTLTNSLSVGAINAAMVVCKYGHVFDKFYSGQRCCSICHSHKVKRLREKWKAEADKVKC